MPTFNPIEINNWLNARAVDASPFVPVKVDDRLRVLRVSHENGEALHPLGVGAPKALVRQYALEILVLVEPFQCVTQVDLPPIYQGHRSRPSIKGNGDVPGNFFLKRWPR